MFTWIESQTGAIDKLRTIPVEITNRGGSFWTRKTFRKTNVSLKIPPKLNRDRARPTRGKAYISFGFGRFPLAPIAPDRAAPG